MTVSVFALGEQALVVGVRRERDGLVEVVARDRVRAGEGVRLDDVLVGGERVGREDLVVDDGAREARQDEREDLVVLGLEVEDDGGVVGRLDAVEVVEQARGAVRVGDREVAVERELDVGGGEVVAVGPLEALGQRDRVLAWAR